MNNVWHCQKGKATKSLEIIEITEQNDFSQLLITSFDKCIVIDDDKKKICGWMVLVLLTNGKMLENTYQRLIDAVMCLSNVSNDKKTYSFF